MSAQQPSGGLRVAAYVRTSKPAEEGRQHQAIAAWCAARGFALARTYQDIGGRRHEARDPRKRPEFQQLIAAVQAGRWDVVVVEEQSRFGALGREFDHYVFHFEEAGTELWEATQDRCLSGSDVASVVLGAIGAAGNRAEVQQIATRTLGGKLAAARAGRYQGGPVPYGMALQARDAAGAELWTLEIAPDGRRAQAFPDGRVEWHDPGYSPGARVVRDDGGRRRRAEQVFLVPTRMFPERLGVVRSVAGWYLQEHISPGAIARRLNGLGLLPPGGRRWWWGLVERVLRTPWTGRACYGRRTRHRYATIRQGAVAVTRGAGKLEQKDPDEWVWSDREVFPPVLDPATQEAAWAKLAAARAGRRRHAVSEAYLLSGLVVCGRCGKVMNGMHCKRAGRKERWVYRCADYARYKAHAPRGCRPLDVDQEDLLAALDRWLAETGQALETATAGGEGEREQALLRPLYDRRAGARAGLDELKAALEGWLRESLTEVFEHEDLPDGRRRFVLADGRSLDLPGATLGDVHELHSWAWAATAARHRDRLAELEAEHDRWFRLLAEMPTAATRQKAAARLGDLEAELGRLRAAAGESPSARLAGLWGELQRAALALGRARRELAGDEPRRRAAALRRVVDRVVVGWSLVPKGGREVARVTAFTIEPVSPGVGVAEVSVPRRSRPRRWPNGSSPPAPSV